ncbi:MAG: hypothetical protein IPK66_02920 [Rhodospirillales bacterium]|nr:hypothetical protein [Rhodospirillales bacterium]
MQIMNDLHRLTMDELRMALDDWRRWRDRVQTAEHMRLRVERFAQACANIAAIEREMDLRTPEGRERLRKTAEANLEALVATTAVPISAYRQARHELMTVEQRICR